jgi:hypothetical protein
MGKSYASYLVEINRVTQWLFVLNSTSNISLSLYCLITLAKYATTSGQLVSILVLIAIFRSRYVEDSFPVL